MWVIIKREWVANVLGFSDETPLHLAVGAGSVNLVKWILEKGGKVDARTKQVFSDEGATTPLHEAAKQGHADIVKILLNHGADINAQIFTRANRGAPNYWGNATPLILASQNGHKDAARILIERGAKFDIQDCYKKTARDYVEQQQWDDILKLMPEKK
ncbi:MAG: ankyrin repeat domain-containing protein [Pseudomonadota bacterium]